MFWWSNSHPLLAEHTDNMRIIDSLIATEVLRKDIAVNMRQSYLFYREIHHKEVLYGKDKAGINEKLVNEYKNITESIWNNIFSRYDGRMINVIK